MDLVALDMDGESTHFDRGIFRARAGFDMESPTVPRALHVFSLEPSVAERAAGVGTGIVQGVRRSIDVTKRKGEATGSHSPACARWNIGQLGYNHPVGHGNLETSWR
jgi:hypothetical protein